MPAASRCGEPAISMLDDAHVLLSVVERRPGAVGPRHRASVHLALRLRLRRRPPRLGDPAPASPALPVCRLPFFAGAHLLRPFLIQLAIANSK